MEQNRGRSIGFIELTAQPAKEHHGKLQTLGLMDGQNLHSARTGHGRNDTIAALAHTVELGKKTKQALMARPLQLSGLFPQGRQIGLTLPAVGHSAENSHQVGPAIQPFNELVCGQFTRTEPKLPDQFQKSRAILPAIPLQRGIEVTAALAADLRQTVGCKSKHRGAQHRQQRNILPGVVDDFQKGQRHRNLGGFKEIVTALGFHRNTGLRQRPDIMPLYRAGRAHKNHHIVRPHRALTAAAVADRKALPQHLRHPSGHKPGLGQILVDAVLPTVILRQGNHIQLGRIAGIFLKPAAQTERLVRAVLHFTAGAAHNVFKDKIGGPQNLGTGTEIL